jgi:hypothetical protein
MADSAASTQPRTPRASSTKRRANTVSTETENKLARAARSAQRLAQLSDVPRDDSTLDMFPDDPTRATLEAMNIDIRQGTLHGFELPDVVLAAVGAPTGVDGGVAAASEARAARRTAREKSEAPAMAPLAGFERIEPTAFPEIASNAALFESEMPAQVVSVTAEPAEELGAMDSAAALASAPTATGTAPGATAATTSATGAATTLATAPVMTSAMAAATVARSVTALRQAAEPAADASATGRPAGVPPQRFATTFAKAATASRDQSVGVPTSAAGDDAAGRRASTAADAVVAEPGVVGASPAATNSTASRSPASRLTPEPRLTPELDQARATAFADTVDALYGVISDQRRAATDHSRRMKWMLSIVVGALLATVAIGVTQTVLLMRLTHETTAQQHRIEEMMQNQQAAMTSLLDAHLANATAAAVAPPAPVPAAAAPATPRQAPAAAATPAAATSASKRSAKAHAHPHKPKTTATTPAR